MDKPPIWDIMRLSGLPWGEARTQAAYQCLNGGYQWLFMLDCDVLAPKETIPRLISHRLPIASGLYHQRFPTWTGLSGEYLPCMFNEVAGPDGKLAKQPITEYTPGSLVEVAYVPGGCLLAHRSVFERMLQAGIKRFFEWTLTAENPAGRSEDFEWCARVRAIGFKCFVDTSLVCQHETQAKITTKGLEPKI